MCLGCNCRIATCSHFPPAPSHARLLFCTQAVREEPVRVRQAACHSREGAEEALREAARAAQSAEGDQEGGL